MADAPHANHGLFSDHYLDTLLPELSGEELEQAREAHQRLRAIYAEGVPLADGRKEAPCEQYLLRPALKLLGFARDEKPPLPTVEATFEPDYALFAAPEDLAAVADADTDTDDYYAAAVAIAEAKRWDRDLGSAEPGEDETAKRQHPGAQIRRYLLDANVRWGILTNGRVWRIYEREASRAGFRYYEIDLPALLDADVQDFRFFWLLFRRDAYVADAEGRAPVARVLDESRRYWLDITSRLRNRVYDALEALMTGMINGSRHLGPDDLPRVHEACLIVLYRLLFAFYAEARKLLPVRNETYREDFSVQTRLRLVTERHDDGRPWPHARTALWQWFRDLSRVINDGDPETGVPEYDGGLFDPAEWPLLADPAVVVHDDAMAEVIDRVGRDTDPDTGDRAFLDYHELSVRELGSIYEGLLEMRPHYRDGAVVLETDRGERKATGSYYTPEYIVDYIVANTLDPLLKAAAARVAERCPEVQRKIAQRERLIADRGDDDPENAKTLARIEALKLELLEPYFELMVLDPAMGSGHFLVAASEEITEAIITDPHHMSPAGIERIEDENIFYKRRVVERCLYGVDLNPLAVELAKLSLWLHTVEFGKPLSFLKHHLREGNSLIGARLAEMHRLPRVRSRTPGGDRERPAQLNLFTSSFLPEATRLLQAFNLIEKMPTDTLDQEHEKEAAWADIEHRRERFRQVANVWLSVYFGGEVDDADYARAVDALGNEAAFEDLAREEWFAQAQALAAEHTFFHWELEFPDAFFTEHAMKPQAERGFDAVVGNPPWGAKFTDSVKGYSRTVDDTASGPPESFRWFMSHCLDVLRAGGSFSMIVPNTWLSIPAARGLRSKLLRVAPLRRLLQAPSTTFPDVSMNPLVFVLDKRAVPDEAASIAVDRASGPVAGVFVVDHLYDLPLTYWRDAAEHTIVVGRTPEHIDLVERLGLCAKPFGADFHVELGAQAYHNTLHSPTQIADRVYHAHTALDKTYMAEISGANVRRHHFDPRPREYLSVGDWLYLVPEARFLSGPRLLVLRVTGGGGRIQATWADGEFVAYKALSIVKPEPGARLGLHYAVAIVNSNAATYWHLQYSGAATQDVFPQLAITELNTLPIRIIDFEHPTEEGLKEEALGRCREAVEACDYQTPYALARAALAAHAALHGPAGKPELREDDYWAAEIAWFEDSLAATPEGPPEGRSLGDRSEVGPRTTTNDRADFGRLLGSRPQDGPSDDETASRRGRLDSERGAADLREDFAHDLLAELAQRMIHLNERRHQEKQGFLSWLERTLGCAIDDLSGKTLIADYDDRAKLADFGDLCRRLCSAPNRRNMAADPRGRDIQERIEAEYDESLGKLDVINADLAATDRLIDRIVYALYGLGPDEVAIIEESLAR